MGHRASAGARSHRTPRRKRRPLSATCSRSSPRALGPGLRNVERDHLIVSRTLGGAGAPALYVRDSSTWRGSGVVWRSASEPRTRGAVHPVAACGTRSRRRTLAQSAPAAAGSASLWRSRALHARAQTSCRSGAKRSPGVISTRIRASLSPAFHQSCQTRGSMWALSPAYSTDRRPSRTTVSSRSRTLRRSCSAEWKCSPRRVHQRARSVQRPRDPHRSAKPSRGSSRAHP